MKNLLYTSTMALLILLTACTSMNNKKQIVSPETTNISLKQISDRQNPTDPYDTQDDTFEGAISGSSSKEISHVLELCKLAQDSWKKGATPKALDYLDKAYASILDINTDDITLNTQKENLRFIISKRIMEIYTSRQIGVKGEHKEIPITINKYVQNEIDRFTGSEKEFFIRSMARAAEYRPAIVKELKDAGLPEELSWLPLIESGFRVQALSPARALGLWQFIPSTGYKFGLKRDYYVDERMDPVKSTQAAIKYLSELHKMFGDWSTVLAAYNCGEGKVLRTIRSQNVNYLDNFWDLYEKLPQETACYVPRFIATLHIMNNLEKYDIPSHKKIHPLEYQTVTVNKQIRLTDIARKMSVSRTVLESLNPELKYGILPPEEYQLRIPANTTDIFISAIDDITPSAPVPPKSYSSHKVKRGETLFSIAKNYGVTMGDIAGANNMSNKVTVSAGKMLKIPESGFSPTQSAVSASIVNKREQNKQQSGKEELRIVKEKLATPSLTHLKYQVKNGDTMWSIARKHNTTPDAIKAANSLYDYTVNPDKELIIPEPNTIALTKNETQSRKDNGSLSTKNAIASNSANVNANEMKVKKSTHWVKSGDTPFTIAQKYNMSVQSLFDLNRLPKGSKIFPGQKLLVK